MFTAITECRDDQVRGTIDNNRLIPPAGGAVDEATNLDAAHDILPFAIHRRANLGQDIQRAPFGCSFSLLEREIPANDAENFLARDQRYLPGDENKVAADHI